MIYEIKDGIESIKKKYDNNITDLKLYAYVNFHKSVNGKYANTERFDCCEKGFDSLVREYNKLVKDDNVWFIALGLEYRHTDGKKLPGGEDIVQYKVA